MGTKADPLSNLEALEAEFTDRSENEAETRHKIIDLVLHDLLAWPRNRVSVEEFIRPGFADYVLKKSNDDSLLLIEAKRSGVFFTLPYAHKAGETSCYIGIQ